jgi:hypothetical protein
MGRAFQLDAGKLLDLGRLIDPYPEPLSALYLVAVVFFAIVAGIGVAAYLGRRRLFPANPLLGGLAARFGLIAAVLGLVGLLLILFRALGVPYVSARILIVLTVIAAVALIAYVVYFFYARYPAILAEYRAAEVRRRYTQPPKQVIHRRAKKKRR